MAIALADKLGSPLIPPSRLTHRHCRANVSAIHLMLRAAVLLSYLRSCLQRFSTSGHPETLVTCPRRELGRRLRGCPLRGCLTITATGLSPVSRRQLSGHTSELLGRQLQKNAPLKEARLVPGTTVLYLPHPQPSLPGLPSFLSLLSHRARGISLAGPTLKVYTPRPHCQTIAP